MKYLNNLIKIMFLAVTKIQIPRDKIVSKIQKEIIVDKIHKDKILKTILIIIHIDKILKMI